MGQHVVLHPTDPAEVRDPFDYDEMAHFIGYPMETIDIDPLTVIRVKSEGDEAQPLNRAASALANRTVLGIAVVTAPGALGVDDTGLSPNEVDHILGVTKVDATFDR